MGSTIIKNGDTIKNYKILSKIEEGAQAIVYHAVNTTNNLDVAIKTYKKTNYRVIQKEIQILAKLGLLYDSIDNSIVIKYFNGSTLKEYIDKNKLETRDKQKIVQWFIQAVEYLKFLHLNNIYHRDIKVTNLMLHDDRIVFIDFGLSQCLENKGESKMVNVVGTPNYMSKYFLINAYNIVSYDKYKQLLKYQDYWSLLVCFYLVYTDKKLFESKTMSELIKLIKTHNFNGLIISDDKFIIKINELLNLAKNDKYDDFIKLINNYNY